MAATDLVPRRRTGNEAALVFVHGFTGGVATWDGFATCIAAEPSLMGWDIFSAGYSTNLRLDFAGIWSADPDLKDVAKDLHTTFTNLPLGDYKAIAISAHSMGVLAVHRALLEHTDLVTRTTHVFFFGTPSGGLKKARVLWRLKRQLRDMAKGGAFIRSLR